ncbi:unnamed protein product [Cunninghamella blakesleeana]
MLSPSILSNKVRLLNLLQDKKGQEDIKPCGRSINSLYQTVLNTVTNMKTNKINSTITETITFQQIEAVIDMTNETILSYPYKDVPYYWRRMLMDASLLKVICLLEYNDNELDYKKLIEILDTALIVSGGPGQYRRAMTLDLIQELHTFSRSSSRDHHNYHQSTEKEKEEFSFHLDPATVLPIIQYPIEILSSPPDYTWFEVYINSSSVSPLHLKGELMNHWPALTTRSWSNINYILDLMGDRLVPIEIGSKYTDHQWQQKMMTMEDFIFKYILKNHLDHHPNNNNDDDNDDDNDNDDNSSSSSSNEIAYLAQHDLFYQIPLLENDISIPDYCFICPQPSIYYTPREINNDNHDVIKNAWFGPKGTVSPLHHDPYHNLLAQVVGRKYIRLYAPTESNTLYPYDGIMTNTSQVDIDHPDTDKFPLFTKAKYIECILYPGEILYIPPKWWHYVRSLDTSFSVSFWF